MCKTVKELIRLCTKFFDEYGDTWKENGVERRKLEEEERQREERRRKAEMEKLTFKCGFAQKRINFLLI